MPRRRVWPLRMDTAAAIAGEAAAEHYGLEKLAENIEDEPDNTTRFLVIGQHDAAPSGRDKTSLVMSARNRPGAVYRAADAARPA